jgi:hypothetical protein
MKAMIKMKKQNCPDTEPQAPVARPTVLTLRFDVEGILKPVVIKIPLASLTHAQRVMLADRLRCIDVCQLLNSNDGTVKMLDADRKPVRIMAKAANWPSLLEAIHEDQQITEERLFGHQHCALAVASVPNVERDLEFWDAPRPSA